jgi:hypothetical protein
LCKARAPGIPCVSPPTFGKGDTMKKFGTGKPPRKRHRKRKPLFVDITPIESMIRCSCLQTCAYLGLALPKVYALIKSGELTSYIEDGRRWITPESVMRFKLPPDQRPPLTKKPAKFEHMRRPPKRTAMEAA